MKKILLTVALIFAFAKYECAQNAAAPQQEQQQQVPNTITIGDVILKFENNKWYKIQNQVNALLTIEDLYNILRTIYKDDVLFKIDDMIEIQSNYGVETIDNTLDHIVEHGHIGGIPFFPHKKQTNSYLRYEVNEPRSIFHPTEQLRTLYQRYIDSLSRHENEFIFPILSVNSEIKRSFDELRRAMKNRAQRIIKFLFKNYIMQEIGLKELRRQHTKSINMIACPQSDKKIRGIYPKVKKTIRRETIYLNYRKTNNICIFLQLKNGILRIVSIFPTENLDSLY